MYNHHDLNEAPVWKKARVEVEDCIKKRTDALTRKIEHLTKEFPEMKYNQYLYKLVESHGKGEEVFLQELYSEVSIYKAFVHFGLSASKKRGFWKRNKAKVLPRDMFTEIEEAFVILSLENALDVWNGIANDVDKTNLPKFKYTANGKGKGKGSGRSWTKEGMKRYNKLIELVMEKRKTDFYIQVNQEIIQEYNPGGSMGSSLLNGAVVEEIENDSDDESVEPCDQSDLNKIIEPAVVKYRHEVESEKKANSPIYMLPNEILEKCFSYVGEGSYLLVAPVSTKFCKVYKDMLKKDDENKLYKTTYEVAVTSVSTAKYCLEYISQERDARKKLFFAAALKGKLDVLKLAKHVDILHFWVKQKNFDLPIGKIAQAGHLHILQSLKDDFNMGLFLGEACHGATLGGQIHILEWLKSIDCLHEFGNRRTGLCDVALCSGQVETLKWLRNEGFEFVERIEGQNMFLAIGSKKIDMLSYCIGEGFSFSEDHQIYDIEAVETENSNIVKFCFENGCEFSSAALTCAAGRNLLDICKYLQSKSVQWEPDAIKEVIASKSLEMLKFAHENGCEWSQDTWACCMRQRGGINWDMMNYLYEKNCPWKIFTSFRETLGNNFIQEQNSKTRKVIEFMISKKLPWGENLLLESINYSFATITRILVENTSHDTLPKSLSYIVGVSRDLYPFLDLGIMEYLHSQGIPFGEGFLKKLPQKNISTEEFVVISKWALENSYQPSAEEIHIVSIKSKFNVNILGLLYEHSDRGSPKMVTRTYLHKWIWI